MAEINPLLGSEVDLLARAYDCLKRAGSALDQQPLCLDTPTNLPKNDDVTRLHLFLEAQSCIAEVLRRQTKKEAEQDRKREDRHFWIEMFFTILITALIGWEIWEGRQQATLLRDMQANTAATALQIQKAAEATTASLQILQQERAERGKKPRLALYVGNIPIGRATVRLAPRAGNAQDMASIDLLVKNEGDALANPFQLHVLVPEGVHFALSPLQPAQEYEEPSLPATRTMSYEVPLMPVGKSLRVHLNLGALKGRPSFKAAFTVTTAQLEAVTPLGSLTVLPPKP